MSSPGPILLAGVAGLALLVGMIGSSSELEAIAQDNLLKITNVGNDEIEIVDVAINDRKDCAGFDLTGRGPRMKVGDERLYFSQCKVIRANVKTITGTSSFDFR